MKYEVTKKKGEAFASLFKMREKNIYYNERNFISQIKGGMTYDNA